MADIRESFAVLEDSGSQAGVPLHKALEGEAVAGKNAHGALVAKNSSEQFKYLAVNSVGALITTSTGDHVCQFARGKTSGSASPVTVAEIVLVNGEDYENISWVTSCFRDAIFEIVKIDDTAGAATETILAEIVVGPGDFTDSGQLHCVEFTAPASLNNVLRLRASNLNSLSDMRGTISAKQLVAA